ncbi:MAG: hypothetical protein NTX59_10905 [Elusimicrobia bacterium]|nr:hypothetical protein [Elusimicrobiota bacterium]
MEKYSLILSEPETANDKAAAFMVSALGLEQKEAELCLKVSPGFLIEGIGLEPVMKARAQADSARLKTMVIASPDLPLLPRPVAAGKIEFKSDGFYYQNKVQKDFVRYDSVTMLAAAAVEFFLPPVRMPAELEADLLEELRRKFLPALIKPGNDRPNAPAPRPRKEIVLYSDIFSAQGDFPHLRFKYDEFDFSGLGAAKTYSSAENFRLTLDELEARTFSKPFMNRAFRGIKKRTPARDFILPSLAAYEKELLWLACLGKAAKRTD